MCSRTPWTSRHRSSRRSVTGSSSQVPKGGLLVDIDPARMTQVFGNMLNNAAKYTDRGGVITITAMGTGDHVIVTIEDNGIGIPLGASPEGVRALHASRTRDRSPRKAASGSASPWRSA